MLALSACVLALASPASAALPKGDVVFIVDESGSMGAHIADVRKHITAIASSTSRRIDARYALVAFGGSSPGVPPNEPFTRTDFTNADGLVRALEQSGAYAGGGGGKEMGLYATTYAMNALAGFRADAATCAVLVSDEPPSFKTDLASDLANATDALERRNAVWLGVVRTSDELVQRTYGPDAGSLANVSGGAVFSIRLFRNDPAQVLAAVIGRCTGSVKQASSCTITGTWERDVLHGTPARDVICALAGDDVVYAAGGNDTVYGGVGNDSIQGGGGIDGLLGGPGRDLLAGQGGADRLAGGIRADRLTGGLGADSLLGERGNDVLLGGRGDDALRGGPGGDSLVGHAGRDRLLGEGGNDRLGARDGKRDLVAGGSGADVAVVDAWLDRIRAVERVR
jgi:hypothetical protein